MQPYPHVYQVAAVAGPAGPVPVSAEGLAGLETAPPPEFDGPGGVWSPETLLAAAVADCYVLSFRAVARAARFEWSRLECRVEAVLEKVEGVAQFSRFTTHARLGVPPGADPAKGEQLLAKAEHVCLVANSLRGSRALTTEIVALPA
jgi:organic hydroperoxide reductase OsmC/OhrA